MRYRYRYRGRNSSTRRGMICCAVGMAMRSPVRTDLRSEFETFHENNNGFSYSDQFYVVPGNSGEASVHRTVISDQLIMRLWCVCVVAAQAETIVDTVRSMQELALIGEKQNMQEHCALF
jgi:hypothetical protein